MSRSMMTNLAAGIFWTSAALLVYVYLGYPAAIAALAAIARRRAIPPRSGELPSVSLVISAHNESHVIGAKLENSLQLDYPPELIEIVVVSDCSDDGTDEIVQRAGGRVRLVRQGERRGKSAGLNKAVPLTRGAILVFSDANALYARDAIRKLVDHFSDPAVGYVVGSQRYVSRTADAARAEGLYWRHETWLKRKESQFYSVVGGDGAIYATRRELYAPLQETDINDFLNPLQIVDRGFVGVFEPTAECFEEPASSITLECRRKTRIVGRSLLAVCRAPGVLNPFRHPRHWFMLVSHKVVRWFTAPLMIALLASSLYLGQSAGMYRAAVMIQIAFYSLALLGGLGAGGPLRRVVYVPWYFCAVNVAAMIGVLKCMTGNLAGTWATVREARAE